MVSKEVAINLLEHLIMLYIQALELVSKEVVGNQLVGSDNLIMLYIQASELVSKEVVINQLVIYSGAQRSGNQYVIYSGFRAG